MDFEHFLTTFGTLGSFRMRVVTGFVGAVCFGLVGYFNADVFDMTALSVGVIAALVGGCLGALFSAAIILLLIMIVILAGIIGWSVMTGGS